jgi:hypothetical protein
MARYAEGTQVPVEKSKMELERLLTNSKAKSIGFFHEENKESIVVFQIKDRRIRFNVPMPALQQFARVRRPNDAFESEKRRRWRALLLVIKAKLESVENGIETFDDAFLAHVMMPDGATVGDHIKPQVAEAYKLGRMPPIMAIGYDPEVRNANRTNAGAGP